MKLFDDTIGRRFLDVSENSLEVANEYLLNGIREYMNKAALSLVDILSNRIIFKDLISFLHETLEFKYVEIMTFFEIPNSIIRGLKK